MISQPSDISVTIVDDNDADIFFTEMALRKLGVDKITSFSGATDFLKSVASGKIDDLVLMDIRMPDLDGFQAIEKLETLKASIKALPTVFMLSSIRSAEDVGRAREMPSIEGFLQKPLTMEKATTLFASVINRP